MIDWGMAGALLGAIHRRRDEIARRAAEITARAPRFQNLDFPLSPLPVAVEAGRIAGHRVVTEHYVQLVERVLALYHEQAEVRSYFRLNEQEERLALLEDGLSPRIRIARLDGYLEQRTGRVVFLENNADCPAGILFSERIDRMVDEILGDLVEELGAEILDLPLDRGDAARQTLLAAYREQGGESAAPAIAILQIRGRANLESQEMVEEFSRRGTPTFIADPREVELTARGAELGGRRADLIWNKVNTCYWNELLHDAPDLLERWATVIDAGAVCHVNPFVARYVAESKRCAAFFQEEEFAAHFSAEERDFLAGVLPWSRVAVPGKRVDFRGETWELEKLLLARQSDFVLKQPYDIRGDGVTIGRSVEREPWEAAIGRAFEEGHTAQEFITGRAYPILLDPAQTTVTPMTASLDSFMFGGVLSGLGSKGGLGTKVNVFQGGRKLAVRPYETAP